VEDPEMKLRLSKVPPRETRNFSVGAPAQLAVGQLARDECDCSAIPGRKKLTKLKECIRREYHREAALGGFEPAKNWLQERYPGWGWETSQPVPAQLVKEQIKLIEREQLLAAVSQLLPSLEEVPEDMKSAYAFALDAGRPLIDIKLGITKSALAKVEGLTLENYSKFIAGKNKAAAEKGGKIVEGAICKIDWSLPDETILGSVNALLKLCRPIPPIYHEKGRSTTVKQLEVVRKALVIYRLRVRAKLTVSGARERLADLNLPTPYSEKKDERWNESLELALRLFKNLREGKFLEAVQNFVMTKQASKLRISK
jgi:hypothetical protein